ncbi:hypothetical protein DIURU_003384 [Diutina rugosa]|uniref:Vesicular-fusion protein SEC17 n=1 Tax=Diutina rugosa TaxID=5481 RepID=A0A642USH4_DIURU|nr:uncharacterized protein DIURU_003384 [Diutina rugosa]KAA8901014.1 hypothetical protein DIURU_003384 [Diutina rugosa]
MADPKYLISEAEKLLKPQSGFMSFFSGSSTDRKEDASDCFVQAGNAYRLQKNYVDAGAQFVRASDIQTELGNHNEAANHLVEAYKCYKDASPSDAIEALKKAIHIFLTQNGQFRRAANFTGDLAELYEKVGDQENAILSYEQAGDYFSTDRADALASKSYLKCADLCAATGDYAKAIKFYDNIIKVAMGNNLSRWSLKDYFFKVILCLLCMDDEIEASKRLEQYSGEEPSFESSREGQLLRDILEAIEAGDLEKFQEKVFDYDKFSKLDKLKTQLLLKVKNQVVSKEEVDLL